MKKIIINGNSNTKNDKPFGKSWIEEEAYLQRNH